MKSTVYTRKGDSGTTCLSGNIPIKKSDDVVEALGAVDELNALLGCIVSRNPCSEMNRIYEKIQGDLFIIQAIVASAGAIDKKIAQEHVAYLEHQCDMYDACNTKLSSFVVPGGSEVGSLLHYARVVCRRAERSLCRIRPALENHDQLYSYINRLSDLLFICARFVNRLEGQKESHPTYV